VCGEVGHLAAQCARRVVPVVAAAATPQGTQGINEAKFAEFQAWRAQSQAAAATRVADPESGDDEEWDDEEYELGAVALPCGGEGQEEPRARAMAAAGTKAGAVKARATREAKKGRALNEAAGQVAGAAGAGVAPRLAQPPASGTAKIAGPVSPAELEALRGRWDKAAARERLAKLPDHRRNVAPQGLHRLPKSFAVAARTQPVPGVPAGGVPQGTVGSDVQSAAGGAKGGGPAGNQRAEVGAAPPLTGEVTLPVLAFLELAQQAGLSLAQVTLMAKGGAVGRLYPPIRLPVEGASLAKEGVAGKLSPIAALAHAARGRQVQQEPAQGGGGLREPPVETGESGVQVAKQMAV
jgi:hypothetical protein